MMKKYGITIMMTLTIISAGLAVVLVVMMMMKRRLTSLEVVPFIRLPVHGVKHTAQPTPTTQLL